MLVVLGMFVTGLFVLGFGQFGLMGLLFGCLWMFSLLCHVGMTWCCLVGCYLLYDETIELLLNVIVGGFVCYVFDLLFGLGLCWFWWVCVGFVMLLFVLVCVCCLVVCFGCFGLMCCVVIVLDLWLGFVCGVMVSCLFFVYWCITFVAWWVLLFV